MTEEKTKNAMSIFERYLTVWVGLCIVGGIVLGKCFNTNSNLSFLHDVSDHGENRFCKSG